MGNLGSIMLDVLVNLNPFNNGLREAENAARQSANRIEQSFGGATNGATRFGDSLRRIGEIAWGVTVGNAITAVTGKFEELITGTFKAGIGFNAMKEQAELALGSILKNGDAGKQMMSDLWNFAAHSPFQFQPIEKASQMLLAMGTNAKAVIPEMTNIGNAVSALGGGAGMLEQVASAMGQITSSGHVNAREMMRLTQDGIPAWKYLAQTLNTDVAGAMTMVTKKQVDSATALRALNEGMQRDFGGMMDVQSRTFNGLLTTLKDNWLAFAGEALLPVFDGLKVGLTWLTDFMGTKALDFGKTIGTDLRTLGAIAVPALKTVGEAFRDLFALVAGDGGFQKAASGFAIVRGAALLASDGIQTFIQAIRGDWHGQATDSINVVVRAFGILGQTVRELADFAGPILVAMFHGLQAGASEALSGLAAIWTNWLAPLLSNAIVWGQNIVVQFANGIVAGVGVVVEALNFIGGVITEWLQPHSPPKLLPELDQWGTDAANIYMSGWGKADFTAFDDLAAQMEKNIRAIGKNGAIEEQGIIPMILVGRSDLAAITDMIRTTGAVTQDWLDKLIADTGPAGAGLAALVQSFADMSIAQRGVETAQQALTRTTDEAADVQRNLNGLNREYEAQIAPLKEKIDDLTQSQAKLNEQLKAARLGDQLADLNDPNAKRLEAINDAEQQLADNEKRRQDQRIIDGSAYTDAIAGYQQTINNPKATPEARAKAERDLAELRLKIEADQARARLDLEKIGLTAQKQAQDEQRKARDADIQRQITAIDIQKQAAQQQINDIKDQQAAATQADRNQLAALTTRKAAEQDTLDAAKQTLTATKDRYDTQKQIIAQQEKSNALALEQVGILQQQAAAVAAVAQAAAGLNPNGTPKRGAAGPGSGVTTTETVHNPDGTTSTISTNQHGVETTHTNLTPHVATPHVPAIPKVPKPKVTKGGKPGPADVPYDPSTEITFVPPTPITPPTLDLSMPKGLTEALAGWTKGFDELRGRIDGAKSALGTGWAQAAAAMKPLEDAATRTKSTFADIMGLIFGLPKTLPKPQGTTTPTGSGGNRPSRTDGSDGGEGGTQGGLRTVTPGGSGRGGAPTRTSGEDGAGQGIAAAGPTVDYGARARLQLDKWIGSVTSWLTETGIPALKSGTERLFDAMVDYVKSDELRNKFKEFGAIIANLALGGAGIAQQAGGRAAAGADQLAQGASNFYTQPVAPPTVALGGDFTGRSISGTPQYAAPYGEQSDFHGHTAPGSKDDPATRRTAFENILPEGVAEKVQGFRETVTGALTAIQNTIAVATPIVSGFFDSFGRLGAAVGPILSDFGRLVESSLGPAVAKFTAWKDEVLPLWVGAFEKAATLVATVLGGIMIVVTGFINAVAGFFRDHRTEITGILSGMWQQLEGVVTIGWSVISNLVKAGLDVLNGNWKAAWNDVAAILPGIWAGIKLVVEGALTIVQNTITTAHAAIQGVISTAWSTIETNVTNSVHSLGTTLDKWSSGLSSTLNTWSSEIGKKVGGMFDAVAGSWKTAWSNAGNAIANGITGGINGAITMLNSFGDKVAGVMNSIATLLHAPPNFAFTHIAGVAVAIGTIGGDNAGGADAGGGSGIGKNARGTADWRGGLSVVGEEGPELVYLPQHAAVIPNGMTNKLLAAGIPGFADGLNLQDLPGIKGLTDLFTGGKDKLADAAMKALGIPDLGPLTQLTPAILDTIKKWIVERLTGFVSAALPTGADGKPIGPENVQRMYMAASSQMGLPYIWGGGHGGGGGPGQGFDCSGFVAWVLDQGGISNPHGIVTSFYEWMSKGRGKTGVVDIGVDNPFADPTVQHVGISLLGDTFEFGGAKDNGNKNGTSFGEWGQPPGYAGMDKAKGNASNIDTSWLNLLGGKAGQFSAGNIPPLSTLFDFMGRHPGMVTPDAMARLSAVMPGRTIAMANGGIIDEIVRGVGQRTGQPYLFGENGPESVTPLDQTRNRIAGGLGQGIGMAGHFPERVLPNPNHPGWWIGVKTGTEYDGDGNPMLGLNLPGPPQLHLPAAPQIAPQPSVVGTALTEAVRAISQRGATPGATASGAEATGATGATAPLSAAHAALEDAVRKGIDASFLFGVFGHGVPGVTTPPVVSNDPLSPGAGDTATSPTSGGKAQRERYWYGPLGAGPSDTGGDGLPASVSYGFGENATKRIASAASAIGNGLGTTGQDGRDLSLPVRPYYENGVRQPARLDVNLNIGRETIDGRFLAKTIAAQGIDLIAEGVTTMQAGWEEGTNANHR